MPANITHCNNTLYVLIKLMSKIYLLKNNIAKITKQVFPHLIVKSEIFFPHMLNTAPIGKKNSAECPKPIIGIPMKQKYGIEKNTIDLILSRLIIIQIIGDSSMQTIKSLTNHNAPTPDGIDNKLNLYPNGDVVTIPSEDAQNILYNSEGLKFICVTCPE